MTLVNIIFNSEKNSKQKSQVKMSEITVGEVLKQVLSFFELEAQGKCRIRVDHPLKRLSMATGLSRSQIYYRLHPKEPTSPKPKVS